MDLILICNPITQTWRPHRYEYEHQYVQIVQLVHDFRMHLCQQRKS